MTMVAGGMGGFAAGPANALRFSSTRGRMLGGFAGMNYPSPFFDIGHTYLPATVKQMFRWCRYYFLTNPVINATVFKLSEYPITDIVFDAEDKIDADRWQDYFTDHLQYRAFQVEVGLDYFTYGNAFISVSYPIQKWLSCRNCRWSSEAKKCRNYWIFTSYAFRLTCPKCGLIQDADVQDRTIKNPSGIRLIRWNPEDMEVTYNDLSGHYTYFYTIPQAIRNDIVIGRKEIVEDIPQAFIQAMKEQKGLIFSPDKLFHMRRPTIATQDRGWGIPLLLPVLKDTFLLQVMRKAQEAILLEHVIPLRVLFPQPSTGSSDPYTSINLVDWRDHVATEIARWRWDPNYMPILPLPIGNQTIGGDGKALLMTNEIMSQHETILMGMGVPMELLKGGLSYAGTNVSLRMLENFFLGYVLRHRQLLRFVQQEISTCLGWPDKAKARFKPFKMADDIQRKAYRFQLNGANKISDTTLLLDDDLDQENENKLMEKETTSRIAALKKQQIATAEVQGEASLVMAKYQMKAQQEQMNAMGSPPAPGEPGGPDAALTAGGGSPGGQSAAAPGQVPADQAGAGGAPDPLAGAMPTPNQQFEQAISSTLSNKSNLAGRAGIDLQSQASSWAQQLAQMDPASQVMALNNIRAMSPELADMVTQILKSMGAGQQAGGGGGGASVQIDTRPLPEQRAPRRALSSV